MSSSSSSSKFAESKKATSYVNPLPRTHVELEQHLDRPILSDANVHAHILGQLSAMLGGSSYTGELHGLDAVQKELYDLLESCVKDGQNVACLLLGFHGSGKSSALQATLRRLKATYLPLGKTFVEVYVNGFTHKDDTAALREICRQLCEETDLEVLPINTTFADLLQFLMHVLNQGKLADLPVIFVLDEFDKFAVGRKQQTLLYNLSDLLQAHTSHMAIVGVTTRLDAYELLEKRIRSRLSYRRLSFGHISEFTTLLHIMRACLMVDESMVEDADDDGDFLLLEGEDDESVDTVAARWNAEVDAVLVDPAVLRMIRHYFALGKDPRSFLMLCTLAVSRGMSLAEFPKSQHFIDTFNEFINVNRRQQTLQSCAVIELTLLVALLHLEKKGTETYTFALAYKEYQTFHKEQKSSDMYTKAICWKAFQRLVDFNLVQFTSKQTRAFMLEFQPFICSVNPDELVEFIKDGTRDTCPTWLVNWAVATKQVRSQKDSVLV